MGGLSHLFDSETRSMARKIVSHKKHDGLDAPRDSLELRNDNYQAYYAAQESPVEEDWPENNCYPFEASMKKLISEEISQKPSTRQSNGPSIVARLMGMDVMMGLDAKLAEKRNGNARVKLSNKEANGSTGHFSRDSSSSRQLRLEMCYPESNEQRSVRPRSREHPQEEELQRFKKEFVEWQTARLRECSGFAELGNLPPKFPAQRISKGNEDHPKPFSSQIRDSAPTKIVVLKPGPDQRLYGDHRDSWSSSPCSSENQRGSIEDFLEEVRDRLKCEMQGKMLRRGSVAARGSGIETPYSERPSDPKQIAQTIAKHARESAGTLLVRSESARSHGNGPDTRGFVSERLKNVLKKRGEKSGHSRSYSVMEMDLGENQDERRTKARSFRYDVRGGSSPRSLVRSLSAPVSGTSFGKLLLEDRHVLTGAHVRRKLEATTENYASSKSRKKEKLNFKDRVSSFRYSFSLRRRLFGKKIIPSSAMEPSLFSGHSPFNDIASGPTVISNSGERHDNFTEVPPSPASVCSSSAQDELLWRHTDHLSSPQLTPDITPCDDYALPQAFREISSNLTELRRQLNQLESDNPSEGEMVSSNSEEPDFPELNDPAEAYVRDLLVASGQYDGSSSEKFLMKWEKLSKPVSASVFKEVEERYKNSTTAKERRESLSSSKEDRKLLHDLLNESLSTILGQPCSSSSGFRGNELMRCVWEIVGRQLRSSADDRSIDFVDDLVARDLRSKPWTGSMDDIVSELVREIESLVMGDLVRETLENMRVY